MFIAWPIMSIAYLRRCNPYNELGPEVARLEREPPALAAMYAGAQQLLFSRQRTSYAASHAQNACEEAPHKQQAAQGAGPLPVIHVPHLNLASCVWAQCAPGEDHAGQVQPRVMSAVLPGAVALDPARGAEIHGDLGAAQGISGRSVPLPFLANATGSAVNVQRA